MADSIGSLIDKLCTVGKKMYDAQSDLYVVRKMSFDDFKAKFGSDEGLKLLYDYFHKATNLNLQRQAMILEVDKKIIDIVKAMIDNKDPEKELFVQDQFKTY